MESQRPIYAYKETRLDLDSSILGSTVAIRIPSHGTSTWPSRTAQKRSHVVEIPVAEDEETFRQRHLATAASVYHRAHHQSPRSFLWRILEGGKVLAIRAVDVSKQSNVPDANLTLRLSFPSPIVPACIAFSDSKEHDVLSAFVLTESNHLFTLTLRPDYFRRASSTEGNVGDWCKSYLSSAFSFKHPYRLVALTADELLVSLIDGGLLKLSRNSGGDGLEWKEVFYNEGGWSNSLRSLIPFHGSNTVRYGKHNIELSAVASIASPVTHIDGVPYAFAISLDHRIRIWNLMTAKIAYIGDVLGQEQDTQETVKKVIDPSLTRLIKTFNYDDGALCVTYSPLGTGEFKFWKATPQEDGTLELTNLFPKNGLKPRTPTPDLWTLADFSVVLDQTNMNSFTMWTLWKNNTTYRVQNLEFEQGSWARVNDAWTNDWTAMATETLHEAPNPVVFSGDPLDITDKWLEFIMSPGRFSTATIETGLALCESISKLSKNGTRKTETLPARMCSIVASSDSLKPNADGNMGYETLQGDIQNHWLRFFRLLIELDKLRGEAQSLVIDPHGDMPWVVLADGLTAVRQCSRVEKIWHNINIPQVRAEHVALPLAAASEFRGSFSEQLLYSCKAMLLGDIFEEQSLTDPAMMLEFYDKCDFYNRIRADDIARLEEGLGGGYKNVTPEVYEEMLGAFVASLEDIDKRPQVLPLAEFGNKLIIKGVQEIVELHSTLCLDQVILLVYIEAEINHEERGIGFSTTAVFSQFLTLLKRLELVKWLATTRISLPLARADRSNSITENNAKKQAPSMENITVLEGVLRHLFGLDLRPKETMTSAVTQIILQICATNSEYELSPSIIQCFLLNHDRPDLAMEFSRFAAGDPFSTYIQGRACLASNDPQTAALLFKKAAYGMSSSPEQRRPLRSAGYLDDTERNSLNAGLPQYYSHIVYLYDKEKIFTFVIEFARLALQFLQPKSDDTNLRELRTEMHSRLFNAAIHTARFEQAHSTITLFTDHALQQSSLRILVTRMCESSYASELVELPFLGLQGAVDEILAQKCQSIVDVTVGIPYHKILYAWRIKRSDFRGAATVSLERLQKLQQAGEGDRDLGDDSLETPVTKQYIALINALSCVDPKQAWILSEEPPQKGAGSRNGVTPKRKVVTLDDIRKEYQGELDRIAAIDNNQFALAEGDEMDVL